MNAGLPFTGRIQVIQRIRRPAHGRGGSHQRHGFGIGLFWIASAASRITAGATPPRYIPPARWWPAPAPHGKAGFADFAIHHRRDQRPRQHARQRHEIGRDNSRRIDAAPSLTPRGLAESVSRGNCAPTGRRASSALIPFPATTLHIFKPSIPSHRLQQIPQDTPHRPPLGRPAGPLRANSWPATASSPRKFPRGSQSSRR